MSDISNTELIDLTLTDEELDHIVCIYARRKLSTCAYVRFSELVGEGRSVCEALYHAAINDMVEQLLIDEIRSRQSKSLEDTLNV